MSDQQPLIFHTQSVDETQALGRKLGALLRPGDIVALVGDLGAGKTWLSKGIAAGLGVQQEVDSPAFDIIHEYQGRLPLYHMDFYRLDALSHIDEQWLDEYLVGRGVCLLEWADKFIARLADSYLRVELRQGQAPDTRELAISAVGQGYAPILEGLRA
jgi:tRNA threonylcarbamoyladenosine biosynthesis protein TsaE